MSATLAVALELAYLFADLQLAPSTAARTFPIHLAMITAAAAFPLATHSRWFGRHWELWVWMGCAMLMAGMAAIAIINMRSERLFFSVLLVLLAAGATFPWTKNWQISLELTGVICLAAASSAAPVSFYQWLTICVAIALAHYSNELWERNRAELTELKLAERHARESEEVLRQVIESCPDPIAIRRLSDGRYIVVNKASELTGYTTEETLAGTLDTVRIFADEHERRAYERRLRRHGVVRNMEVRFMRKDGTIVPCLISGAVVELNGEQCVVSFTRDIARLRHAEQKVRESEAVLRKIIETCPDPISINLIEGGKFVDVNPAWVDANGYAREEILGKSALEVGIWADTSYREEFLKRLQADSVVKNMEIELRRKDGGRSPYLISGVLTELGGKPSIISIGRDITELKRTEQELRAAREAALAAARAKSEFLSNMSHEIRTPMNAVLGMAELLWDSPLTPEQRRYVNVMRANGDALVDLINDILDLAKIESGRLGLERVGFGLDDLVDKLGEMMGIRAHEKGLELAIRVAPGVPTNLIGDPLRLRQILVNLLGNAIKFTEHGEVVLSIERAEPADGAGAGEGRNGASGEVKLRFSVKDTGIGIAKDKLGLLFTSFTQADSSTSRTFGGTGLGLAISKRLAELYGGKISVESEPGVGSCFSFTVSLGVGAPQAKAAPSEAVNLSGLKVLVVDDTEINRLILKEILEREGALVSEARSGAEALAQAERAATAGEPYQLIVLDCRMPEMDGIEVARRLKASHDGDGRQAPVVVMLTSDDLSITPALLGELGIHTYLVKPVRRAELLDAIGRSLGGAKGLQSPAQGRPQAELRAELKDLRILLADDSPDNRLLVSAFLGKTGWKLDEAEDGAAAVEMFKAGKYDLVLMDMRMPVMDGLAATKAIREWERQNHLARTPIIALTASVLPETVHECLEAGCDSHVSKPVSRAMLFSAINRTARRPAEGASPAQNASA
ncbi:MAG TPA: response regulator [Candidatus Binataceae bacterium]|nr:response regulator [Candidatus Binataceae bacterium]